jgi:hypothetical protein
VVIRDFNLFCGFCGIVNFLVIFCLIAYIIQEMLENRIWVYDFWFFCY